ncbi:exodeoxyribonuclease V subunit alpha [Gordonia rubripertincta]|uniref:exodeoxyribonuclease V subunit alpha n=1 Tax=Gordonia rubripertincta TaxID=36822 RepID=UPI0035B0887A
METTCRTDRRHLGSDRGKGADAVNIEADHRIVRQAHPALVPFNRAGVLSAADIHVAQTLATLSKSEIDPTVLLAAALAVRAVRLGSVCVEVGRLSEVAVDTEEFGIDPATLPWPDPAEVAAALARSPLVVGADSGPLRPLYLAESPEGSLLYLRRYFLQEQRIREVLDERAQSHPIIDAGRLTTGLKRYFPDAAPDRQRVAAALATAGWTTVIAGGPGTGKTHTVARVLALMFDEYGPQLRVALAAPTGRAAAQLEESVRSQSAALGLPEHLTATTLHRLLGWKPSSRSRFAHDANNRLPHDLVVVDETSMVSLTMMSRLLDALRPHSRLVLVGDPDQLASVDAGAVLADLVARPVSQPTHPVLAEVLAPDLVADAKDDDALATDERDRLGGGVIRLTKVRRFGEQIKRLASAVREGDSDLVIELLGAGHPEFELVDPDDLTAVRGEVVTAASRVGEAAAAGDPRSALAGLQTHRLLCAHREGSSGVEFWSRLAMEWIDAPADALDVGSWYPGQPLLVTANDYDTGIFNGDTGVVVRTEGRLMVAFARGSTWKLLHPSQLVAAVPVYAMTIHRSQGSQYESVSVVIPPERSALLTRELLYTAITRASGHVRLIGTEAAVRAGVDRKVLRASGLRTQVN